MSNMHTPNPELLKRVRAALVLKGSSLNAFCRESGLTRQNVSAALAGNWRGPKASALVQLILAKVELDR